MSSLANPAQGVAQNTKLCSFDIDFTLPASISLARPSRPWPYSEARAFGGEAGSSAERGMLQTKGALVTPIRRGSPRLSKRKLPPGAHAFVR